MILIRDYDVIFLFFSTNVIVLYHDHHHHHFLHFSHNSLLSMTSHANNATHMKIIVPAIWQWMSKENYQGTQISSIFYSLSPRQNEWLDRWWRKNNE
jgi:hypothetical protein